MTPVGSAGRKGFRCRPLVALALFALAACGGGGGDDAVTNPPPRKTYTYTAPADLADGWAVGHLQDHGADMQVIQSMMDAVVNEDIPGVDAISAVRNNVLILNEDLRTRLDEYDGWVSNTRLDRHVMHSTTKSFVSALTGIAIDQGYIRDVDVLYYDLFTYGGYDNWSLAKAGMTLEDALTMRFGFAWDEWSVPYGQPGNSLWDLFQAHVDVSKGLLDQRVVRTPGTMFVYNTAGTISLGQALEHVIGVPLENFADQYLFAPLQIQDVDWTETPTGLPNGGSGLFLTTREMLKFGQLYLDGGVWHGERVISEEWVIRSTQPHADYSDAITSGYGYQWWIDRFLVGGELIESYSTRGFGGQNIFVVPSRRLGVAVTGRNYGTPGADAPYRLMQDFLLRAMD